MQERVRQQPSAQRNVFGEPLATCSERPVTGFYRSGCCHTGPEDLREAFEAGRAPLVVLAATHEATLELVELGDLKRYAIDLA
jgi:uncharacterized protein